MLLLLVLSDLVSHCDAVHIRTLNGFRQIIETVNDQLGDQFQDREESCTHLRGITGTTGKQTDGTHALSLHQPDGGEGGRLTDQGACLPQLAQDPTTFPLTYHVFRSLPKKALVS